MADIADRTQDFGANSWLVEEMYERYRADQNSVSEAWREFFSDYRSATVAAAPVTTAVPASPLASSNGSAVAQPSAAATAAAPAPAASAVAPVTAVPEGSTLEPLRGVGAAIVTNMEKSLSVPTATSFRNVPARLLEVNRKVINDYRSLHGLSKVSFLQDTSRVFVFEMLACTSSSIKSACVPELILEARLMPAIKWTS